MEYLFKPLEGVTDGGVHAQVHLPKHITGALPIAIAIHGGSWSFGGSVNASVSQIEYLLENGIAVVSLQYRLAPHTKMDEIRQDVLDGYKWILNDLQGLLGDRAQLDTSRCMIIGWSAGGSLTIHLTHDALEAGLPPFKAIIPTYPAGDYTPWARECSEGTLKETDRLAQAVIAKDLVATSVPFAEMPGGKENALDKWKNRSEWLDAAKKHRCLERYLLPYSQTSSTYQTPFKCLSSTFPPTGLVIACGDTAIPPAHSLKIYEDLKELGVEAMKWEAEGAPHGFAEGIQRGGKWWEEVIIPSLNWAIEKVKASERD